MRGRGGFPCTMVPYEKTHEPPLSSHQCARRPSQGSIVTYLGIQEGVKQQRGRIGGHNTQKCSGRSMVIRTAYGKARAWRANPQTPTILRRKRRGGETDTVPG